MLILADINHISTVTMSSAKYSIHELIKELNIICLPETLTEIIVLYTQHGVRFIFFHYGGFGMFGGPTIETDGQKQKLETTSLHEIDWNVHPNKWNLATKSLNGLNNIMTCRLYFQWIYRVPIDDEVIDENNRIRRELHKTIIFPFSFELNLPTVTETDLHVLRLQGMFDEANSEYIYACPYHVYGHVTSTISKDGVRDMHIHIGSFVTEVPNDDRHLPFSRNAQSGLINIQNRR